MNRRQVLPLLAAGVQGPFQLKYKNYLIPSSYQPYDNSLRVLEPAIRQGYRILYVLPVNPDVAYQWGDGFETIAQLGLHNKHGFVVVAPSFSTWPWYADHPTNSKIKQESYFLKDVVPFVDRLYPNHKRLLVGFSKSGNGAFTLLLRNPQLFTAAAAWDAPLMKEAPDQFGMSDIYSTQANFELYSIPKLLTQNAELLRKKPERLALLGFDAFEDHMKRAHELMDLLKIPHHYANNSRRQHRWDTGWLPVAMQYLDEMTR